MMTYGEAVLQDRYRACGVRLLPMTLGHACLLQRMKSPWISEAGQDERCELKAVILCAMICSRPWTSAANLLNGWRGSWLLKSIAAWRRNYLAADYLSMSAWFEAQWESPITKRLHKDEGPKHGADFLAVLAVSAQVHLGVSRVDVLDLQIRRLQYELLTLGEQNGSLLILDKPEPTWADVVKEGLALNARIDADAKAKAAK